MKLNKNYKIEKAASTDDLKPGLQGVFIDAEEKRAVTTNGYILASVPVENAPEKNWFIPSNVFNEIKKHTGKKEDVEIEFEGDEIAFEMLNKTVKMNLENENNFPDYKRLIYHKDHKPFLKIGINPKQLLDLAEAFGNKESIVLNFYDDAKKDVETKYYAGSIGAESLNPDLNAFGLISPFNLG